MIKRVYIEITNICNLSCSFCLKNTREPKTMSLAEFESIIKQVKQITEFIYLHVQGEPLLHPDFDSILSICDRYGMKVQLVTNGSFLTDHMNISAHSSLRKVSFSLQSIEHQKSIDVQQYLKNIILFSENASKNGAPYVELRFWRNDQANMPKTKYCLDYIRSHYSLTESKRHHNYRILDNVFLSYDNSFEWPDNLQKEIGLSGTCHGAVEQIAILSNGEVVPCCLDADGHISFGNIFTASLDDILSSNKYISIVEGFKNNRIIESFCAKCTFRLRFSKKSAN